MHYEEERIHKVHVNAHDVIASVGDYDAYLRLQQVGPDK